MRATGGAGRTSTHERGDGSYRFEAVAGGGKQFSSARPIGRISVPGGVSRGREAASGGKDNEAMNRVGASKVNDDSRRNAYRLGNWYAGIQRRQPRPRREPMMCVRRV